jgi:hypothetical protein
MKHNLTCPFCKTSDEHNFVSVQFDCEDREGIPSAISCDSCGCRSPWIYVTKKEWENSNGEIPITLIKNWKKYIPN